MPQKLQLEPPLRVSPFIRFCRWSLLLTGVWYGAARYRSLKRKEDAERDYVEKMKPIWMEEKKKIVSGRNRDELLYLSKETGLDLGPDFDKEYPPYTPGDPEVVKRVLKK